MANFLDTLTGALGAGESAVTNAQQTLAKVKVAVYVLAAAEVLILIILLRKK